jgi:hypothetical protein
MSERISKRVFASRPRDAESWIKSSGGQSQIAAAEAIAFTARLTIDITPEMRGRIKVVAFQRGVTVAEMLRELLTREFPEDHENPKDPGEQGNG